MRRRKKVGRKKSKIHILGIMVAVLMVGLMSRATVLFQDTVEKLAIISTFTAIPDKTTEYIKDRFYDEIYNDTQTESDSKNKEKEQTPTPKPNDEKTDTNNKDKPQKSNDKKPSKQPPIPEEYRGEMIEEFFGVSNSNIYVQGEKGYIKNSIKMDNAQVKEIVEQDWGAWDEVELGSDQPQVLIYHTHATESFEEYDSPYYDKRNTWRSVDNDNNITLVGGRIADILQANDINVIHDTTQHDYPSYNGSYEKSRKTVTQILEDNPSIKIVLDIHRDAIQRDDVLVRPVVEIDGKKVAQVMIIAGSDDGTMNIPNWRENLRFGTALQDIMEEYYPGLGRPLFLAYRKYNQDLSTGSILIEVGSHGNTLDEVMNAGELVGECLVRLIKREAKQGE